MLIDRYFVHPLATIIRRNAITSVGGYDERLVVEDYDMWLRLAEKYDLVFCEGVFSKYRIVSSSMTRTVFINPTPNYSYGNYLICEKWLTSGLLSPAQYTSWVDKQMDATYWLYFHGDRRARKCLWKVFFRSRNLKVLLQATTCSLGITRPLVIKLTSIIFNRQSNDASARHEN